MKKEYIFGYGSLINSHSRACTIREATDTVIPCIVQGFERSWSYQCNRKLYTAVSVTRKSDSFTNGVLILIDSDTSDLTKLDAREKDYARGKIQIHNIQCLGDNEIDPDAVVWIYENHDPTVFNYNPNSRNKNNITKYHVPCRNYPIPESYVDCILVGCLEISTDFAHSFVTMTTGWKSEAYLKDREKLEKRYTGRGVDGFRKQIDLLLSRVLKC